MRQIHLIILMCLGIILALTCYANFPALQPDFEKLWRLTKLESGLIFGIFFGGMFAGTPILSPLADRIDPKKIWIFSTLFMALSSFGFAFLATGFWSALIFRGLTGFGLAGVYMPGLKILTDRLEGDLQSRATVLYTASFIIGFSASFAISGEVASAFGWQWTFIAAGILLIAALLIVIPIPPAEKHHLRTEDKRLDFRPTFRSKPVMAFITAYGAHCLEAFTAGSWSVAFLTFHLTAFEPNLNPAFSPIWVATIVGLIGLPSSVIGNELAIKLGRRRVIFIISSLSATVTCITGFLLGISYWLLVTMAAIGTFIVTMDSGALSAGMVQRAPKGYTATTMAIYSMAGFGAGLIGPFCFGAVLQFIGGTSKLGWGLAYALIGLLTFIAPIAIRFIGVKDDPGT